ncbi:anaerobic ribonucleoside-triphosphate reductase activating protein [Candidatus Woesearchaeota archaeon]|nr:anaerobic ribonucleoside-triphosphate reductase activating protein [Candidatus Woesearchaeota archaeon]
MDIYGFQKNSLVDFPHIVCSVIFLGSCNFRCPYCYNPELVVRNDTPKIPEEEVFKFLESRKGFIDGVTITGGEPTMHQDLPEFIKKVRALDLKVKLDTNGSKPDVLKYLIENKLVDFISMDIKNTFEKYEETVNMKIDTKLLKESISLIIKSGIDHEFRTTVVPRLHKKEDIVKIAKEYLKGAKVYVLQQFVHSDKMINETFKTEKAYTLSDLEAIKDECVDYVRTEIRNL